MSSSGPAHGGRPGASPALVSSRSRGPVLFSAPVVAQLPPPRRGSLRVSTLRLAIPLILGVLTAAPAAWAAGLTPDQLHRVRRPDRRRRPAGVLAPLRDLSLRLHRAGAVLPQGQPARPDGPAPTPRPHRPGLDRRGRPGHAGRARRLSELPDPARGGRLLLEGGSVGRGRDRRPPRRPGDRHRLLPRGDRRGHRVRRRLLPSGRGVTAATGAASPRSLPSPPPCPGSWPSGEPTCRSAVAVVTARSAPGRAEGPAAHRCSRRPCGRPSPRDGWAAAHTARSPMSPRSRTPACSSVRHPHRDRGRGPGD